MHNALLIPEVRSTILDCLAADTGKGGQPKISTSPNYTQPGAGQKALAALARTCRTLSESALDALWCLLPSLEPLLQCSRDKDSYVDYDESVPPFDEKEWNVVLRHAPRVRELIVMKSDELSIKILESLWFHTTVLLPNLRKLHWNPHEYTNFLLIRLLLSPSLVHLDVHLPIDEDGIEGFVLGFLRCYHTFCPKLKSLHFRHRDLNRNSSSPVAAISRAVCCLPTLEALTCHALSEEAFLHVAKSRDIKKFSARLLHHHPDDLRRFAESITLDYPLFENLRVLHLRVCDVSTVIPYLKSYHQPFEEISIEFSEDPSPEILHEFFTALSSPTRQQSLRRVKLGSCQLSSGSGDRRRSRVATKTAPSSWGALYSNYQVSVGRGNTSPVHFEVLAPLAGFSLHDFEVHLNNPILLNDNDLGRLVQGWPDLETFSVTTGKEESSRFVTLMGMLLLLARCPKLCRLKLCVDARTVPVLTPEESRMCNMVIEHLEVASESPIKKANVAGVAQFLHEHFPSLTGVTCPRNYGSNYPGLWETVNSRIKKIRGLVNSKDSENYYVDSNSDSDSDYYH
ncbi:hypothetical protein JVU11DRAFT_11658 [Chiua virens]|nr:hypothetical protein JVU11DRAFT_11658 [Chiua virens]